MLQKHANDQSSRVSRRGALRIGVGGAAGAGLVVGVSPAIAQPAAWRTQRLEMDAVVGTPVSILRAGEGPPQRGDWFHIDAQLYPRGQTDGPPMGVYQCFGAWTHAATDTGAFDQRFTSVQFRLDGRGAIMGIINEAGADPTVHVGAVQGGTGEFAGALGTFQQLILSGPSPGVAAGTTVFRAVFDIMLPNMGVAGAAPAQVPRRGQAGQEFAGE